MIARNDAALSTTIVTVIPGDPCAQGRGRAVRIGAGVRIIDPARSRSWKGAAQVHYIQQVLAHDVPRPAFPDGPLKMEVDAYFTRPKSLGAKASPLAIYRPSRPDADNIGKACMDAAIGVLFGDDAQVVHLTIRKFYAAVGDGARVEVSIERIPPPAKGEGVTR